MKGRPILFSAPMVRALLAGTKTQTRRVVKPQPTAMQMGWHWVCKKLLAGYAHTDADALARLMMPHCPYGKPGDRLWVRETWYCDDYRVQRGPYLKPDDMDIDEARDDGTLIYRASSGDRPYEAEQPVWRPAIHMPRWASRITLEVTGVRVERLQDISEEDAIAEGLIFDDKLPEWGCWYVDESAKRGTDYPVDAYRDLWEQINGPGSWDANPWVWCVSFRRV